MKKNILRNNVTNKIEIPDIRIQKKDFNFLEKKKLPKILVHFNLQYCGHKIGQIYLLPKITKSGYFISKNNEKKPSLKYHNSIVALCVEVRENLNYEDLKKEDFKYSLPNIRNIEELKKEILYRYTKSLPKLSKEKILSLGVSYTKLKILGRLAIK